MVIKEEANIKARPPIPAKANKTKLTFLTS